MAEWNRNVSRVYEISGEKIISKEHQKLIFLRREQFFYDLFGRTSLVKTPKIYQVSGLTLQTHFIETEEKDIHQTAEDWARVHSYFIRNPVEENRLMIQHNIEEVSSYVLRNINLFGRLGPIVKERLSRIGIKKDVRTILHGDLQQRNMVTFKGNNYYFDFELGGVGHPGRDVASMVISNPDKKEELLTIYRQHVDFDYSGLEEDVDTWIMARTTQLYIIFDKRKGTPKQKKTIKGKLSRIIEGL